MSNRKLFVLGIAAGLMIIWAVGQSRVSNRPGTEPGGPVYLIQGLDPADIAGIVLGTGDNTVSLKRQQDRFVVAEKDDYPALSREINELITQCLDIKRGRLYTDDKANHKDLAVTEEDAQNVVKFYNADSSLLTGVVIGKTMEQGGGSFVRLVSSDSVYITLQRPWIKDQAVNYIDQQLISIDRDDIESVTVSGPNETYTLKAEENSGDIFLENLAPDKKLKDDVAKNVFAALTNLRFNDVRKQSTPEALNFEQKFVCRLKDSTVYTINLAQKNDKTYVACSAEFTDKIAITQKQVQDANDAELMANEARLLARDRANEFSGKHAGWLYEIADYKVPNMVKKLSELLEDK
jgi:hypothetical protein